MSDYRTDRPYWCESCARQKDCYGITLRPKCFVPIADRKTEPQAIRCPKCGRTDYIRDMEKDMGVKGSHYKYKCINCNTYIKGEPQRNMVEDIVESFGFKAESYRQAKAKTEPQTEREGE